MKNIYLLRIWVLISVLILTISHTFATDVTISVANDTWTSTGTSGSGGATSVTKSGITVSSTKGFKDGTTAIREYSGCEITVSSSVGKITKIAFTSTASGTSNNGPSKIGLKSGQSGSYSYSGKVGTWTYATGANSVVFSASAQFRWTQVVVTYSGGTTYTVTYNANGGSGTMSNGTGASVTIADCSFTAPSGKTFSKWNTNTSGTGTDYAVGASVTEDLTLYAIWIDLPQYTVNWYVNGSVAHSQTGYEGATLTSIPTPTSSDCDGSKVFVGWYTSTYSHASTAPAYVSPTTIPNGGANYYAVFATASGGGAATWSSTTLASLTSSDIFVISNGSYAMTNNNGTSSAPSTASITVSNGKITSTVNDNMKWNISGNASDGYIFYPNGSTTTWLYCNTTASSSSNNNIRVGDGNRKLWVPNNSGYLVTNDAYTDRYLSIYNNADFRGYTGTGNGAFVPQVFKYSGGTTYSNYETNCCTPLGAINGPVNLTSDGCSAGQLKATWKMSATTGIASQTLKVYKQSDDTEVTGLTGLTGITASTSNQTITISGLQQCTGYYVKVFNVSSGGSYCEGGEVATSGNATTLGYTYTVNLSNASKSSGTVPANTCSGNINAVYAALSGYHLPTSITVTNAGAQGAGWTWNSSTGALTVNAASVTGNVVVTITAEANSCSSYSFHYGTDGQSDWAINCFDFSGNTDRQWILNATIANKSHYYVGKQGSFYNDNLGNSNAKSYTNQMQYMQLALDRSHGSNNQLGSNYAGVQGTLLCYDNSPSDNLFVDFLPAGYYFILDAAGTPTALPMTCTNADMTAANILSSNTVWETEIQTVTSVSYKYTVGIKADAAIAGKAWQTTRYNTNENMTTLKKRNSSGGFTGNLAAADVTAGTRGKYRIWADNFSTTSGEKNWYAHFVPYYRVTYNGNGASGSVAASADVSCEGNAAARTVQAAANGFTAPAHTSFGGWATSAANAAAGTVAYAAGANITLTADVELFAIWTPEANAIITLNNYTGSATTTGYYAGDSFTLPSTNSFSCNDKTFVGWSTVEIANSTTKPASNFYEPGASVTLGATNTFYAVFAEIEESEVLSEDFSSIESGNSTSNSGSSSSWTANSNFGELSAVYQAGGAIRVGKSGLVTTKSLNLSGGDVIVAFKMKGWSDSEKTVSVQIDNGSATAVTCSNSMSGDFEVKSVTLSGGTSSSVVKFTTSSSVRVFLDDISITAGSSSAYSTNCVACNEVTVSYTAPGSGNAMTVKKGSTTINNNDAVKTCSAQSLTVTLTPATHYIVTNFAATGVAGVTTTNVGNVYTVSIPADKTGTLTLTPTFTAETPLTITFDVPTGMGTAGTIGTVYSGDNFNFPNVTGYDSDCVDFIGWVDATSGSTFPNDGTATSEPTGLFKYNDNSGTVSTNKTYKAVYGEKVTDYAESYAKVTSAPANWANDHYLIVYEAGNLAFDGSLNTLDAVSNNVAVTITAGTIPYSTTLAASEFRIAAITGGYSIQSASGKYIGTSSDANSLESSAEAILNTLSISDGNFDAVSNSAHLRYNAATNQTRFRYYKSSSYTAQQAVQLYKYGMNEVVTYTYTTAPACGDKYFVTLASVTGGSPTASPKAAADGTTINIVANPNNGYTFTGWTITKTTGGDNVTSTLLGANSATASTSFTMPAYDVTVTAAYSITDYTITYNNLNGASNTNPSSYTVATADINLADPGERSGYVFKGWYDAASGGNQVTTIANGSTGNVTLWARWAVGYTITWQNGVGATNPTPTGIEDGQAVGTLPVPTGSCELNGVLYSNFVGWYTGTIADVATDPSEAGTLITSATVPNGNVTYHAVYTNMPDYSSTHTSNVTLPASPNAPIYSAKVKLSSEDDAPEYDAIKIGSSGTKTGSFTFTVPSGTTKITLQGVAWNGKTASITLATSVGTITPSTAQSLGANSGATGNSPFTLTSNTTLNFTLANVSSTATITVSNSNERVIVWGINASSASGSDVGYITQCCDNMLTAPVMNSPSVLTSTAITLSWQAVANATGYKVSWNGGDPEDVGTARTYAKTGLEPGTDYSYRVIAKYTTPYCGAVPTEGVVSTKQVYHVTYLGGSGTGECVASGSTADATSYEAGATVTLQANGYTLVGHQFAAWSSSEVALTALSTSFTMPESDVTITATWTAKQDKFYDLIHDQTATDPDSGDPGTADGLHYYIVRSGCSYTVPSLADDDSGTDNCHVTHEKLLGWIAQSNTTAQADGSRTINADCLNADGTVKSNKLHKGGTAMTANNATFYAVWAVPIEE